MIPSPMHRLKSLLRIGLFAAITCGSSACSYDEGYFNLRIKELDELAAKASTGTRKKIEKKKAELLADFKKRPEGDQGAMDRLCRRARMTVKEAEAILSVVASARTKGDTKELAAYQKKFVGAWKGGGMSLIIDSRGRVNYEYKKGAINKKITASISDFQKDSFTLDFIGITTTFEINKAPYAVGRARKMKIDGVELTRVGDAPR